ncbi:hypothetical protein CTAM01_09705 [Colletotrichum tamarilloi]|uniref:Uncharacterized protein n=1 Tax=Colletotrichum tamarilloi TaxID=1209934 RepID=A0ABQ9R2B4_9PEZI|nr:uncharacterized protein CTAM01_09705 [Colletotrichum tamarilloi]KAK1492754.1 hypothetical protein CTAM01_09705 [Colletotrichum tamarilloi]
MPWPTVTFAETTAAAGWDDSFRDDVDCNVWSEGAEQPSDMLSRAKQQCASTQSLRVQMTGPAPEPSECPNLGRDGVMALVDFYACPLLPQGSVKNGTKSNNRIAQYSFWDKCTIDNAK